ncbi:hypothetical protein A3I95_03325 [Candidatus Nomurabacteria bacterium RIFCSPLOWO2_02_FULL_44_12]|uniref:SIMPL domain-containing protein n=1 Tax=Candidatus Nomurabacteria bacterium RIFCSPLOWO2_12_FULL_44_11 TaxID=1801796 RepID=A0A1F6Y7M7_9BACT|nr:MAG: hypothetical protein A3E95_02050 [Candidatus Nomurabacteria bacterium RIFCSPHIGHO2_12_FULL_44_22b]OGJ02378.1 MAG: hypothetical protein A3G53_00260 [Candidatus Nomurabacteria bacterium RIFCSPLOWO2_12_FULL_44_11]OGJ07629.1 MAG: hypothetical protein A3I95_03325 [Candidatus Nomurabacteria bacterium RIFCSPLOWO2_02_FULL_44_12]
MDNNLLKEKVFRNIVYIIGSLLIVWLIFGTIVTIYNSYIAFFPVYPNKTIQTTGQSEISALPDIAYINFSFNSSGPDVDILVKKVQNSVQVFKDFLQSQGLVDSNIRVSQYSIAYPVPDSSDFPVSLDKNYQLRENVVVEIKGTEGMSEKIKKITDEARKEKIILGNGDYGGTLGCLTFENPVLSLRPAWDAAVLDAQQKAVSLSQAAGQSLGKIVSVNDSSFFNSYSPDNYGASCTGDAITPDGVIKPQTLRAFVFATFEVK